MNTSIQINCQSPYKLITKDINLHLGDNYGADTRNAYFTTFVGYLRIVKHSPMGSSHVSERPQPKMRAFSSGKQLIEKLLVDRTVAKHSAQFIHRQLSYFIFEI